MASASRCGGFSFLCYALHRPPSKPPPPPPAPRTPRGEKSGWVIVYRPAACATRFLWPCYALLCPSGSAIVRLAAIARQGAPVGFCVWFPPSRLVLRAPFCPPWAFGRVAGCRPPDHRPSGFVCSYVLSFEHALVLRASHRGVAPSCPLWGLSPRVGGNKPPASRCPFRPCVRVRWPRPQGLPALWAER